MMVISPDMSQEVSRCDRQVLLFVTKPSFGQNLLVLALLLALIFIGTRQGLAGGGPENVFLLANPESQNSLTIANHYIELRKIPPQNVFYLPHKGSKSVVTGAAFRKGILLKTLDEIKKRGLEKQIDYVVYSCDYPWRINFTSDFPDTKFPPQFSPRGSLTGLTYLAPFVKETREEVVSPKTNLYFIEPLGGVTISREFKSRYRWSLGGRRTGAQGLSYILSSMLGVTDGRGNKVSEIIACLERAVKADGTKPPGTVYFMKHNGPRSKPRHNYFAGASSELRGLKVAAQVLPGKFPQNKTSIVGLTCGTAYADLGKSGCRFLPGALADNFTSFGAIFSRFRPPIDPKTGKKSVYQVNVADFIRHGATAACGTVFEPYSIKQKFPLPSVHVHYANGCSIGESFYQSVQGPYQQLLVGDPLCQPWADIPAVSVEELSTPGMLSGRVTLTPTVDKSFKAPIKQYELFVDGFRKQQCRPGGVLTWDTSKVEDGYHDLRIVATIDTPIATQGRLIISVGVKNGLEVIGLRLPQKRISINDQWTTVEVTTTTKTKVDLFCNSRKLGTLPAGTGRVRFKTSLIGSGPVSLHAIGGGLRSKPLQLEIAAR